jgi:hypothetical protein
MQFGVVTHLAKRSEHMFARITEKSLEALYYNDLSTIC